MDRTELSEAIIQEVGDIVAEELRAAGPELLTADLDGIETRLQAVSRRVCGATMERVLAVRAVPRGERPPCPACGGLLRLVEQARRRDLQGLTGDATLVRPTYVCTRADCGRGHAPLDAELGLGAETLMPRLARVVCRAGITGAFDEAAAQVREDHRVAVGGETVRRVTEAVGAVAEAAQQEEIARARRGDLTRPPGGARDVVVAVDGCQVHLEDAWHEMKVGRAAPLGPALRTDHRAGRTYLAWGTAAICAGLEGAEECWWRVAVTAWRAGLGQQTRRVIVLGDGAEWIWNRAAHFLGGPASSSSRSSTSSTPMSTSGPRAVRSSTRPMRSRRGPNRSRTPSMRRVRPQSWPPLMRSSRPAPLRRTCCVANAPISRTTPRAWTIRATWRSSCPSDRARWRACARP